MQVRPLLPLIEVIRTGIFQPVLKTVDGPLIVELGRPCLLSRPAKLKEIFKMKRTIELIQVLWFALKCGWAFRHEDEEDGL